MFKVGEKVVCCVSTTQADIRDAKIDGMDIPVKDVIYTIKEIGLTGAYGEGVRVEELNDKGNSYLITAFRKLQYTFTNAITKELALEVLTTQPDTEVEKIKEKELV